MVAERRLRNLRGSTVNKESDFKIMSKSFNQWSLGLATWAIFSCASIANAQELTIGSKAPKLDIEHWVSNGHGKFKQVTEFETGKVYVVEFWATWCGPCVQSMPHLAETQEKYLDKGVQLISVSDEDLETVESFLKKPVKGAENKEDTYGKLTSAYCLTTDPDKSVNADYMDAAGQNGIPTCFIVGKSGQIEWIGHPMSMDDPLKKVVDGNWDRDAYLKQFRIEQQQSLLMAKVSRPMRSGNVKAALKILAEAREEAAGNEEMIAAIEDLEFRVNVSAAMNKLQRGDMDAALAEMDAIANTAKPEQKRMLMTAKCKALIGMVAKSGEGDSQAAKVLSEIAENRETDAGTLNELAWTIYEAAKEDDEFSKPLIAAATVAAEKAVAKEPNDGPILDTLAHLVHLAGNLDRAIELQSKAIKTAPDQIKEDMQTFLDELKKEKANK